MNSNTINVFNNGRQCLDCYRRIPDMQKDENWVNAKDLCNCQSTVDMLRRRLEERKVEVMALYEKMKPGLDRKALEAQEMLERCEKISELQSLNFRRRRVESTGRYLDEFYEKGLEIQKNVLAYFN